MIRHPISEGNMREIAQGEAERIHPRGVAQIAELLERLKGEEIEGIYSSDSERCRELSQEMGDLFDLTPNYSPLFREIGNGDWANMQKTRMNEYRFGNPTNFAPPNGESLKALYDRTEEASEYLQQEEGRVALISHGWFLKTFLGRHLGMGPKESLQQLKFSNCALSEIILQEGRAMVEYLNNRDFLSTR